MAVKEIKDLEKDKFDDNGAVRISGEITTVANPLDKYSIAAIDEASSTVTYIGKQNTTGTWLLQRLTEAATVTSVEYANISNNGTETTYSLAWTNRATLTFTLLDNLTGV